MAAPDASAQLRTSQQTSLYDADEAVTAYTHDGSGWLHITLQPAPQEVNVIVFFTGPAAMRALAERLSEVALAWDEKVASRG